jgi:hypothetical protein
MKNLNRKTPCNNRGPYVRSDKDVLRLMKKKYRGAVGFDWDCSGLKMNIFNKNGLVLDKISKDEFISVYHQIKK